MEFSFTFIKVLYYGFDMALPLFVLLGGLIMVLGQWIGWNERWGIFNSFYWSFITAFTVGYGDIRPKLKKSKATSIIIALLGIMFTGIVVAITVEAASVAFNKHIEAKVFLRSKFN